MSAPSMTNAAQQAGGANGQERANNPTRTPIVDVANIMISQRIDQAEAGIRSSIIRQGQGTQRTLPPGVIVVDQRALVAGTIHDSIHLSEDDYETEYESSSPDKELPLEPLQLLGESGFGTSLGDFSAFGVDTSILPPTSDAGTTPLRSTQATWNYFRTPAGDLYCLSDEEQERLRKRAKPGPAAEPVLDTNELMEKVQSLGHSNLRDSLIDFSRFNVYTEPPSRWSSSTEEEIQDVPAEEAESSRKRTKPVSKPKRLPSSKRHGLFEKDMLGYKKKGEPQRSQPGQVALHSIPERSSSLPSASSGTMPQAPKTAASQAQKMLPPISSRPGPRAPRFTENFTPPPSPLATAAVQFRSQAHQRESLVMSGSRLSQFVLPSEGLRNFQDTTAKGMRLRMRLRGYLRKYLDRLRR